MSIWHHPITLDQLNQRGLNSMIEFLEIKFIEIGDNYLRATMPVTTKTKQPIGILHGGANVVLAETIASTAANSVINLKDFYCVGLEINANHLRKVDADWVIGITTPVHLGKTTHVWHVEIFDKNGNKTCISRMTAAIISRHRY